MRTNSDVTIYNKSVDSSTRAEVWTSFQITGVMWENCKAANVIRSGLLEADRVAVYIPYARGVCYLSPKVWDALATKGGHWTLRAGDVIVRGLVNEDIDTDYTIGDLKREYDDVMTIRSVDAMDGGMPYMRHWQVGAG